MTGSKKPQSRRPLSVLLAEDDADLRFILSHSLSQGGYLVHEVDTPHRMEEIIIALRAMRPDERPFDIIISDIELVNGAILPVLFKFRDFITSFPTILITSDKSPEVMAMSQQLGVYEVLAKPFDLPLFFAIICHAIAGKKIEVAHSLVNPL